MVTVTAKFKGIPGDDIKISDSYYGTVGGETLPPGLSLTYAQMTGGTGTPVFTTAISNLGETEVDYVCMPFTDATSMLAWETEFGFSDTAAGDSSASITARSTTASVTSTAT